MMPIVPRSRATRSHAPTTARRTSDAYAVLGRLALAAAVLLLVAAPAAAQFRFDKPIDMSGSFQVDCPTWNRDFNVAGFGCKCPLAPSYLTLELTDIEEITGFQYRLRFHYTGELREFHVEAHRTNECVLGGHTCTLWEGYQVFPLTGYYDWVRTSSGYIIDSGTKLSGPITEHGPDFNGKPIEARAASIEVIPDATQSCGKKPGDQLVELAIGRVGSQQGVGGYSFSDSGSDCRCALGYADVIPRAPYPECQSSSFSEGGQDRTGAGTHYYVGDQTLAPVLLGDIKVRLRSSQPLAVPDDGDDHRIDRAFVQLVRQTDFVRPQGQAESTADYQAFLESVRGVPIGDPQIIEPANQSTVLWRNIPIDELIAVGERSTWRRLYYTVDVKSATTDETDLEQDVAEGEELDPNITVTTYFTDGYATNIAPDQQDPPAEHDIVVDPLDAIGRKEALIESLTATCPVNYTAVENAVQAYLNQIKNGSVESTDVVLEGLKRGVLAEQTTLLGAHLARDLLDAMLDGLAALLQNLVKEVAGKKGVGKAQAARQSQLKTLQADRDKIRARMQSRGWDRFDQANLDDVVGDIDVLNDSDGMLLYHFSKIMKAALKGAFKAIEAALDEAGLDDGLVSTFMSGLKRTLDTFLDLGIYQGLGALEQVAKHVIKLAAEQAKEELFDTALPASYCALTQPDLDYSRRLMESWDQADLATYQNDRAQLYFFLSRLTSETATVLQWAAWAEFGNEAGDLVQTAGSLGKAHPAGRAAEWIGWIGKYVSNGVQFVTPAALLLRTKTTTESLVHTAFNNRALPALSAQTASGPQMPHIARNDQLLTALGDAEIAFDGALTDIADFLRDDFIPDAVEASGPSLATGLLATRRNMERAVLQLIEQGAAVVAPDYFDIVQLTSSAEQMGDLFEMSSDLGNDLVQLYLDVLLEVYEGPGDASYVAERTRIVGEIEKLRDAVASIVDTLSSYTQRSAGIEVTPVVFVSDLTVTSDSTGAAAISTSPENFTIDARIANLSTEAVSGLSARLTALSPADSITVHSAVEAVIGGGTLSAADATAGSGTDEAVVSWQVTFDGDTSERERIVFLIEILEGGAEPVSFPATTAMEMLRYGIDLRDADLDGMPDDWERLYGLDPSVDDSGSDTDDDGLDNLSEYENDTSPIDGDSDDDGLSDGEEVTGGDDGFLTDPLTSDSDGDGTLDAADANPIDADPNADATPPAEPAVALSTQEITLSPDAAFAVVDVTNSGGGTLAWGVVVADPALVTTIPDNENVSVSSHTLFLALPDALTPTECLTTVVRILDTAGATQDFQDLTVTVAPEGGCASVLCGDATGDGSITATDALVALNAAVGLGACSLSVCDASGDSTISALDALMILRFAVGSPVELSCPGTALSQ